MHNKGTSKAGKIPYDRTVLLLLKAQTNERTNERTNKQTNNEQKKSNQPTKQTTFIEEKIRFLYF
jgi:hypothetical protein